MKRRSVKYSAAELSWAEAHKTEPRSIAHAKFVNKFGRDDVSLDNFTALCKRNGWLTGRTGCFKIGSVPWSKGRTLPFNANSAATQFKKGSRPHNAKEIGHERISFDGYVEISVTETNPYTGAACRHVHKHKYLWEKLNGPVPDGMTLKSLDGNRGNTNPANWEAIPRAMLPGLNGIYGRNYDAAPEELKPTIMAATKLEHAAREAKRKQGD